MDLLEELKNLTAKFDLLEIDYALCGGLALAIYARPRATLDIDIMIEPDSLRQTRNSAEDLGFTLSAAPMELRYCQMLCTALGSDPVYFNAVNKFYSFNYLY